MRYAHERIAQAKGTSVGFLHQKRNCGKVFQTKLLHTQNWDLSSIINQMYKSKLYISDCLIEKTATF